MRRWLAGVLLCAILVALALPSPFAQASALPSPLSINVQTAGRDGMIRVWLSSIKSVTTYNITINGTYTIGDAVLQNGSKVKIEFSGGNVYATINGFRQSMGTQVLLRRESGGLRIAEALVPTNTYPGSFTFQYSGGTPYAVCSVYLEDYVQGILPYEMDNSFPLEALKAQAVAARTYAMFSKRSSGLYDVTDTTNHQVYRGTNAAKARCLQAAEETAGLVMLSGGGYIEASFGASNGGQTETRKNAWGSSAVPYQTIKDDPYDLRNTTSVSKSYLIHATQESYSISAYAMLKEALAQAYGGQASGYTIKEIVAIEFHTPKFAAPSRVYTQMRVELRYNGGIATSLNIPVFPTVKDSLGLVINSTSNELFTVTKETTGFRITSRRYGHGIGMSQRGAQQMANEGLSYRDILGFYYPGVSLTQYTFTSDWGSHTPVQPPAEVTDPPAQGGGSTQEKTGRVTLSNPNSRLNMRQNASADGVILARLSHGETVTILSEEGSWYRVRYGTLTGYIATQYIKLQQAATPGIASAYVTLQSGRLNVRSEGRATAGILGSIENGALVDVLENGDTWTQVRYGDLTGFVMSQYLSRTQSSAQPASGTATVFLANPKDSLNLRLNPSTSAAILSRLAHGSTLTLLEKGSAWSKVSWQGVAGYVMNAYVYFGAESPQTPTSAPAPENTETPVTVWDAKVSLGSGNLNLRSQPNTSASILTEIPNGASVLVSQLGDTWCAISYDKKNGYVMRRYLAIGEASTTQESAPPTTQTDAPEEAETLTTLWVKTNFGGKVNLRETASISGTILATLPHGTEVKYLHQEGNWTFVQYGHLSGYLSSAYVTQDDLSSAVGQPTASAHGDVYVYVRTKSGGPVNLRATRSTSARIVTSVPNGSKLLLLEDGQEWAFVRYGGQDGYIAANYVSSSAPVVSTDTAAPDTNATDKIVPVRGVINTGTVSLEDSSLSLTVYQEASLQGASTGSLAYGATVDILRYHGSSAQWLYIRSGNTEGYVPRESIKLAYTIAMVQLGSMSSTLNVRASADENAELLATLPPDSLVTVLYAYESGWAQVRLSDGTTGYVSSVYLTFL